MLRRISLELWAWLRDLNRLARFGLVVLVTGASIDLVYHGLILTIWPLPEAQELAVEHLGHWITFLGMLLMLAGVVFQARPGFRWDAASVWIRRGGSVGRYLFRRR